MPSPLKLVWAKILTVSAVSSTEMAGASVLPRLTRICLADASSCAPSGVSALMALSGRAGALFSKSLGFLRHAQVHLAAAMIRARGCGHPCPDQLVPAFWHRTPAPALD